MGATEQFRVINAVRMMNEQYGMWVGNAAVHGSENLWNLTPVDYLEHISCDSPSTDPVAEEEFLKQFYPEDEMEDVLCRLFNYRIEMSEVVDEVE